MGWYYKAFAQTETLKSHGTADRKKPTHNKEHKVA
jgi:hypothetical protein